MIVEAPGRPAWLKATYIIVAPLVVMLGGAWFLIRDIPPIDDSDLRLVRREVADEDNGYRILADSAEEILRWPGADDGLRFDDEGPLPADRFTANEDFDDEDLADAIAEGRTWHEELAAEIVAENGAAFELLDRALAAPEFELDPPSLDIDALDRLRKLSWIVAVDVHGSRRRGELPQALRRSLQLATLMDRSLRGRGCTFVQFIWGNFKHASFDLVLEVAFDSGADASLVEAALRAVESMPFRFENLIDALRVDYASSDEHIDSLVTGAAFDPDSRPGLISRLRFRPNATRAIIVEHHRAAIAILKQEKPSLAALFAIEFRVPTFDPVAREYFDLEGLMIGFRRLVGDSLAVERLTRSALAIRLHMLETGALPERLEDLVPGRLAELPIDPFRESAPLVYSPKERVLYSVGENGVDEGGPLATADDDELDDEDPFGPDRSPLRFLSADDPGIVLEF